MEASVSRRITKTKAANRKHLIFHVGGETEGRRAAIKANRKS